MYMDAVLHTLFEIPPPSVLRFFQGPISSMRWDQDKDEVIMDAGCGPGKLSTRLVRTMFPRARILAVDVQESMVEIAIDSNPLPLVEYSVADIVTWSTVSKWEGQISKLFSVHVFHWIKDQRQSFKNVWRLLKPGGYAAVYFALHSPIFEMCRILKQDPRWIMYLKDADDFMPLSQIEQYDAKHYTDMLTEIGFSIEYCRAEWKDDTFPSDEIFKGYFSSICNLVHYIPSELKDEFKDCIFNTLLKLNGRIDGLPVLRGHMIELIVKKVEIPQNN